MTAQEEYIRFLDYGERATADRGSGDGSARAMTSPPLSPVNAKVNSLGRDSETAPFFDRLKRAMLDKLAEIELRQQAPIVERVAEPQEQAAILAHNDNQAALLESDRRVVERIVLALERMKRNEYGSCVDCEEPISVKRLESVHWAERCVRCQEAVERKQQREIHA